MTCEMQEKTWKNSLVHDFVFFSISEETECEFQMGCHRYSQNTHVGSASSTPCWEKVSTLLFQTAAALSVGRCVLVKLASHLGRHSSEPACWGLPQWNKKQIKLHCSFCSGSLLTCGLSLTLSVFGPLIFKQKFLEEREKHTVNDLWKRKSTCKVHVMLLYRLIFLE